MPRGIPNSRASITTNDVEIRDTKSVDLSSNIAHEDVLSSIAVVTDDSLASPTISEYVKDLKFMEDELTISVGETTDPNAENPVACSVNGEKRVFTRGEIYKVARKFVDSLIKVEDRVKTVQFKDGDGVDQTRVDKVPALKYVVSVHHDPAGETGRRWFQHQCKNAW